MKFGSTFSVFKFMSNEIFIIQFEFIYKALSLNIENITHEESVIFPEIGGNCMNWMLGHILDYRNRMLVILNQEPIWSKETITCYKRGTNAAAEKDNFLQWSAAFKLFRIIRITLILKTLKEDRN